jgi:thiosulfate/3-mercaptopyruvate sulfurtransferase
MLAEQRRRWTKIFFFGAGLCTLAILLTSLPLQRMNAEENKAGDPWTASELVAPAELARELANPKKTNPVTIVYIGYRTLYQGGHIPGALFHGPASTPAGIADLRKWAEPVSSSENMVIYCGCCPFAHCPNIRPAFAALRNMGFTNVRLLALPKDFSTDWAGKGYAVTKGS